MMTTDDLDSVTEDEVDAIWVALYAADSLLLGRGTALGLDLGARFGWAYVNAAGEVMESGWYDTKRKGESEGMSRLRFKRALHDVVEATQPTAVQYESPGGASRGHALKNILRQIGIVEAELTELGVPYGHVHLGTLKKFATGKGNASKDEMREALARRLAK